RDRVRLSLLVEVAKLRRELSLRLALCLLGRVELLARGLLQAAERRNMFVNACEVTLGLDQTAFQPVELNDRGLLLCCELSLALVERADVRRLRRAGRGTG